MQVLPQVAEVAESTQAEVAELRDVVSEVAESVSSLVQEVHALRERGAYTAPKPGKPRGKVAMRDAVLRVLDRAGGPMHVKEITKRALKVKGVETTGLTPEATIAAWLATEHGKGTSGAVRRTAPATYTLRRRRSRT